MLVKGATGKLFSTINLSGALKCLVEIWVYRYWFLAELKGISNHDIFTMDKRAYVMTTSSNGNIFRVTGHLCVEFSGDRWIPNAKASDAELWYNFVICALHKPLSKQSWCWWLEIPSRLLWRQCNDNMRHHYQLNRQMIENANSCFVFL